METKSINFSGKWAWVKPLIIFALLLVLLIPIAFIKSLIRDREFYKESAEDSIMEPVGGQPTLEGLVLAVPYEKLVERKDENGNTVRSVKTYYIIEVPEKYELSAQVNPYYLSRGIFNVPVFNADVDVAAEFPPFRFSQFNIPEKDIRYKDAVLILGIENKKSFTAQPALQLNGNELKLALSDPTDASPFGNAVYYTVNESAVKSGFSLKGKLSVQGGKSLKIVPLAQDNIFDLRSTWSSPSFTGGWLPTERTLGKDGFSAVWNISGLSTVFPRTWKTESRNRKNADAELFVNTAKIGLEAEKVVVDFITPVNNYSQAKRCITYALLFLAVPFLAIFLCELWSAVKIHPIQYFLIGIADILFYLLILSISEHLSFKLSYFIATTGVCAVVLFYATAIFHRFKWGLLLSAVQAVSYFLLFGILQSEDYALLIGSIGIFCVVALLMFLTRKVDWYGKAKA